jgi:hypothetical protein
MTEERRARLQREWVLCALAAAAARFVPVPLLDDAVRERAVRTAVTRTWSAHDRPDCPEAIDILCNGTRGRLHGVAATAAWLPVRLAISPARKLVRVVTAVRGVGRDLAEVLLLARALDRCLDSGWFATGDPGELRRQAVTVRRAHDRTVHTADLRLLEHALWIALRQVTALRRHATQFARVAVGRATPATTGSPSSTGTPAITAGPGAQQLDQGSQVEEGVRRVESVLDRPDVAGALAVLDRRFDAALGTPA